MNDLPGWVIERCVKAYGKQYQTSADDDLEACLNAALVEFLAIIAERAGEGWRIEGWDGADGVSRELGELLDMNANRSAA